MTQPLSPDEIARFQALVRPAAVLLLMMRLGRPCGARELANLLGLDEHTVAKHLRILTNLNLVARTGYQGGYVLLGGGQLILRAPETVKNLQSTTINESTYTDSQKEVVVGGGRANFTVPGSFGALTPLGEALQAAGVGEPKRSRLCTMPHLTPEEVRTWESTLKHEKGKRYSVGLLIHVLEGGDPPPPGNANGHFKGCECGECQRLKYLICPYCCVHPCECEEGED